MWAGREQERTCILWDRIKEGMYGWNRIERGHAWGGMK